MRPSSPPCIWTAAWRWQRASSCLHHEGKHAEADYKTRLQEIVQQNPEERLSYVVEQESGPDHDKHFVVAVRFNSDKVARGEGRSKKMAEQHAAREALKLLGVIKEK